MYVEITVVMSVLAKVTENFLPYLNNAVLKVCLELPLWGTDVVAPLLWSTHGILPYVLINDAYKCLNCLSIQDLIFFYKY